jgi:soluble lytic murein transglycosylase-like protein
MNSQLTRIKIKLPVRHWIIIVLLIGLSYFPCSLLASDGFCDGDHKLHVSCAEKSLATFDKRMKALKISQKVAIKKEEILYVPIVLKAAKKHKIDPAIIMAIIMAESGYNPRAVSKKGAKGLMQLMPRTAKALGVKNIFNPIDNINGGVKYFKRKLNKFKGNVKLALAAYNAGSRNVLKYRGVPPFQATKIYIKKVLKYYRLYKKTYV